VAAKYDICPFEFSLDVSVFADIIICDYNYVFDPRVRLKRFFDFNNYNIQLLIDESHNLVDRARSMYSTALFKQDLLDLRREIKDQHQRLAKDLYKMNRAFLALKHTLGDEEVFLEDTYPEDFYLQVRQLIDKLDGWLQDHKKDPYYQEILELYFEYLHFIRIADLDFSGSKFYFRFIGNNNYIAKIFNIDPSIHLKNVAVESKTFFSATLSPINYYSDILGGQTTDKKYILPSPFDPKRRLVLFSDEISTRYKDREKTLSLVADYIYQLTHAKKGNYLIFFPSYEYLNNVKAVYFEQYGDQENFLIQKRYMDEIEREAFIDQLKTDHGVTAFGVMGGIFSEGIDLKGESLIGVMLVGIGLPKFNYENSIIRDYYNEKKNAGFEYAYTYPSIIKIMQAVGRVIRTENDKGAIVLLGDRFTKPYYRNYLPDDYGNETITIDALEEKLSNFWLSEE
jgi:DNA excision repair protein ERCC-2